MIYTLVIQFTIMIQVAIHTWMFVFQNLFTFVVTSPLLSPCHHILSLPFLPSLCLAIPQPHLDIVFVLIFCCPFLVRPVVGGRVFNLWLCSFRSCGLVYLGWCFQFGAEFNQGSVFILWLQFNQDFVFILWLQSNFRFIFILDLHSVSIRVHACGICIMNVYLFFVEFSYEIDFYNSTS